MLGCLCTDSIAAELIHEMEIGLPWCKWCERGWFFGMPHVFPTLAEALKIVAPTYERCNEDDLLYGLNPAS